MIVVLALVSGMDATHDFPQPGTGRTSEFVYNVRRCFALGLVAVALMTLGSCIGLEDPAAPPSIEQP